MHYPDNEIHREDSKYNAKVIGGTFVTKPAEVKYWKNFQDSTQRGIIPVMFQGEIVKARPKFKGMSFTVPSPEFIEKYYDNIGIFVEVAHDYSGRIWWTGFEVFKGNNLPQISNYPYERLVYFDESWDILVNSKENEDKLTIKHKSGSEILISPSEKTLKLVNKEANSEITISDETFEIIDGSNNFQINSEKISIGKNATSPSAKGEKVEELLVDIISQLNSIVTNLVQFTTTQGTATAASGVLAPLTPAYATLGTQLNVVATQLATINAKVPTLKSTNTKIL